MKQRRRLTLLFPLRADALAACNYLPQSREKIIAALFKALNSTNSELQLGPVSSQGRLCSLTGCTDQASLTVKPESKQASETKQDSGYTRTHTHTHTHTNTYLHAHKPSKIHTRRHRVQQN